jgi:hypothetical protein
VISNKDNLQDLNFQIQLFAFESIDPKNINLEIEHMSKDVLALSQFWNEYTPNRPNCLDTWVNSILKITKKENASPEDILSHTLEICDIGLADQLLNVIICGFSIESVNNAMQSKGYSRAHLVKVPKFRLLKSDLKNYFDEKQKLLVDKFSKEYVANDLKAQIIQYNDLKIQFAVINKLILKRVLVENFPKICADQLYQKHCFVSQQKTNP